MLQNQDNRIQELEQELLDNENTENGDTVEDEGSGTIEDTAESTSDSKLLLSDHEPQDKYIRIYYP